MNPFRLLAAVAAASLLALGATAQTAPGLKSLVIAPVKVNTAVSAASEAKKNSLERVAQAMDGQLIDRLQNTRKYQILARSDADALIEEAAATGRAFDFGDADYLLVVTVDDFQDVEQTANFAALGKSAKRRVIRFSAIGKIYDAKTNKLVETANFQEQNLDVEETAGNIRTDGELSDSLLVAMSRNMAEKIAQRVVDVGYPARIVGKTGKIVTINRGDGTGIAAGQLWEVFALGEELIDPDTGVSLGREELSVGQVRITRVNPQTSQASITGEDLGIDRGALLRRVTN